MIRSLVLLAALATSACTGADDPGRRAHDLEDRLVAPCCWRESIADHDSPIAEALRREIRGRLGAGESAAAVESDLVHRYGEDLRALPRGRDPRWIIGLAPGLALVLGASIVVVLRRRTRQLCGAADASSTAAHEALYEERLDDELAEID